MSQSRAEYALELSRNNVKKTQEKLDHALKNLSDKIDAIRMAQVNGGMSFSDTNGIEMYVDKMNEVRGELRSAEKVVQALEFAMRESS